MLVYNHRKRDKESCQRNARITSKRTSLLTSRQLALPHHDYDVLLHIIDAHARYFSAKNAARCHLRGSEGKGECFLPLRVQTTVCIHLS